MIDFDFKSIEQLTSENKLSDEDQAEVFRLDEVLNKNIENVDILAKKGFILFRGHLDGAAIKVFERILQLDSKYIMAYVWLAEFLLFHWADVKQVQMILNKALEIDDSRADLYYLLACSFDRKGNREKYKKYLQKSIKLAPDWINPRLYFIQTLLAEGNLEEANKEFQELNKYIRSDFAVPEDEMQKYYEALITGRIISSYVQGLIIKIEEEIKTRI
jgi:tetratricopeptide (TPR) repeat protein